MKLAERYSHPAAARSGFSLMELLLVLALMTVLAAITVPSLQGWQQRLTLEQAASTLQQQITETRLRSIQSGERWLLVLSLPEKTSLQLCPDSPQIIPARFRFPADISWKAMSRHNAVPTSMETIRLVFRPDGTCSDISLQLSDQRGHSLALSLDRLTGSVRIHQPASNQV